MAKKAKKEAKTKKIKEVKYRSEEQQEVIRFIIILVSIFVVVGVVYGVSKILIKDKNVDNDTVTAGTVNYDIVTVGTMFNRNYDEYYVAIYDQDATNAVLYSSIISKYSKGEKALKVFFCDLNNRFNREFYVGETGESNPNAKTIDTLALGDFTFVKIKNGKIVKYIENLDDMKKELGV